MYLATYRVSTCISFRRKKKMTWSGQDYVHSLAEVQTCLNCKAIDLQVFIIIEKNWHSTIAGFYSSIIQKALKTLSPGLSSQPAWPGRHSCLLSGFFLSPCIIRTVKAITVISFLIPRSVDWRFILVVSTPSMKGTRISISLRFPFTKNGKPRIVPVSICAACILKALEDTGPYVFQNPDTGKPFTSIHRSWFTAIEKAGLEDVKLHTLRHSFASFLINPQIKTQPSQPPRWQIPIQQDLIFPRSDPELGQTYRSVNPGMSLTIFLKLF